MSGHKVIVKTTKRVQSATVVRMTVPPEVVIKALRAYGVWPEQDPGTSAAALVHFPVGVNASYGEDASFGRAVQLVLQWKKNTDDTEETENEHE